MGNIEDDMYPILESAITGQVNMAEAETKAGDRPRSLLDSASEDNVRKLRNAMMEREGLILSIFELLRTVPRSVNTLEIFLGHICVGIMADECRRLLMILKLSDLQRSLDQSLHTTHGQSRIFIIVARYCAKAGKSISYPPFRKIQDYKITRLQD